VTTDRVSLLVLAVLGAVGAVAIVGGGIYAAGRDGLEQQLPHVAWAGLGGGGLVLLSLGLARVQVERLRAAAARRDRQRLIDAAIDALVGAEAPR
jgi:hypothetical protein